MKKKLMIGLIAGTAVFAAVFGAAATLGTISGESLGASNATVAACDPDGVTTSYAVSYATGGYKVDSVTVSNIDITTTGTNCTGKNISIQLVDAAGAALTNGSATLTGIDAASETLTLTNGPSAASVEGVHVLIKG